MGVISSPSRAGLAKIALVVVAIAGLTAGAVFAYQTTRGDDDSVGGQLEVTGSPTSLQTATPPNPSPPLQQPTATTLPPTQPLLPTDAPPTIDPDCANRAHHHLNIMRLKLQPGMGGLSIRELDENRISIEQEPGVEYIISGWADDIGIGGTVESEDEAFFATMFSAIQAVAFDC